MDRRRFLGSAGAASAVGLAGCAGFSQGSEPEATWTREDSEVYATFSEGEEAVATAGVRFLSGTSSDGPIAFRVWVEQERDAAFTDVRLELTYENRNSTLYLEPPHGRPWPAFRYSRLEGSSGVLVELSDPGTQADGTLTFDFLFDAWDDEPRLGFDVSTSLRSGGLLTSTWLCETRRNVDIPTTV